MGFSEWLDLLLAGSSFVGLSKLEEGESADGVIGDFGDGEFNGESEEIEDVSSFCPKFLGTMSNEGSG